MLDERKFYVLCIQYFRYYARAVSICTQIIKRAREGIVGMNSARCFAKDTGNLHHPIFIHRKCAIKKKLIASVTKCSQEPYSPNCKSSIVSRQAPDSKQDRDQLIGGRLSQIQTLKTSKNSKPKKIYDIKTLEFEIYITSTIKFKTCANLIPNVKQQVIIPNSVFS